MKFGICLSSTCFCYIFFQNSDTYSFHFYPSSCSPLNFLVMGPKYSQMIRMFPTNSSISTVLSDKQLNFCCSFGQVLSDKTVKHFQNNCFGIQLNGFGHSLTCAALNRVMIHIPKSWEYSICLRNVWRRLHRPFLFKHPTKISSPFRFHSVNHFSDVYPFPKF